MPQITIDLTDSARQRLDLLVADYNATNGTSLTFERWLDLHMRELAVQREFIAKVEQLKKQTDTDLQAAIAAERERLLSLVAGGAE